MCPCNSPYTGCVTSQVLQKALDWLAEQPEDASELAALLSEAVPKLGFHTQKSRLPGISRAATSKKSLELLHADMSLLQRLRAARPMLVGASLVTPPPFPGPPSLPLSPLSPLYIDLGHGEAQIQLLRKFALPGLILIIQVRSLLQQQVSNTYCIRLIHLWHLHRPYMYM